MNIEKLSLYTHDVASLYHFYVENWKFPVSDATSDQFTILIGTSRLTFIHDTSRQWRYHFAFNIAPNHFEYAHTWLQNHADIIHYAGQTRIKQSAFWDAMSIYYRDSAGNIGELIARHRLAKQDSDDFDVMHIQNVCEIGIPTDDVTNATMQLTNMGLPKFGHGDETFSAMGDDNGLLILVKTGRVWFPDTGVPADCSPVELVVNHQDIHHSLIKPNSPTPF